MLYSCLKFRFSFSVCAQIHSPFQIANHSLHPTLDALIAGLDACVVFRGKPMDGSLLFKRAETATVISEVGG